MARAIALACGAALTLGVARAAAAQLTASLDAGAGSVRYDGYLRSGVITLTPAVEITRALALLSASGAYSRFESGHWSTQGWLAGSVFTPPVRRLRGELAVMGSFADYSEATRTAEVLGVARAHLVHYSHGLWVGAGGGRVWNGSLWSTITQVNAGAWTRFGANGAGRVSLARTAFRDSLFVGGTTVVLPLGGAYQDAEVAVRWSARALELDAGAGLRFGAGDGDGRGSWNLGGALWLSRRMAVFASMGLYAADPAQGLPGGRYSTLALRFTTRRAASRERQVAQDLAVALDFEIQDAGKGDAFRRIRIRAPNARKVELMADFTDWLPVALANVGEDRWDVVLPIEVGSHRINLRIDGGSWVVPPGLTTVADEFNGIVGLLVVPPAVQR